MKDFLRFICIFLVSTIISAQINNSIIIEGKETVEINKRFKEEGIYPNIWQCVPEGCQTDIYYDREKNIFRFIYTCGLEKTTFTLNFPQIIDGYLDPEPAENSSFTLENRNLNYVSNPEDKLHLHMVYEGNKILKVMFKAKDFNWNGKFRIDFEKEYACPADKICDEFVIGNENTRALQDYLLENDWVYPYLQEIAFKIVENKSRSEEMAKAASIFMKNWLIAGINPNLFYKSGIISKLTFRAHCRCSSPACECEICKRYEGQIVKEVCVYLSDCQEIIWGP
ncbi:MAG: hypothetical protein WHV67_04205 [Thermoanaerobaculia bacterium]